VTEGSDGDDAQIAAELRSLDPDARLVLAVLAVAGRASLSVEELGEVTEVSDARLALVELERRGLVVREDGDRASLHPGVRGRLKRLLASVDVVDRVLRSFIRVAEDGRLTLDDLDAVVELTAIAAETGHWAELLRLAEAAETTLSITHRVEEWVEIVERRLEAARVVGDSKAVIRAEQELARLKQMTAPTTVARSGTAEQRVSPPPDGGGVRVVLAVIGAAAAGALGIGVGYLVSASGESEAGTVTTASTSETVTETQTEAAQTVTETVTETETETVTETVVTTVIG
jgi:hypothetical protein